LEIFERRPRSGTNLGSVGEDKMGRGHSSFSAGHPESDKIKVEDVAAGGEDVKVPFLELGKSHFLDSALQCIMSPWPI
jgi:hypothetical protein